MLVLASASPRRRDLLLQAGVRFEVDAAEIDETRRTGEAPTAYVRRLALEKARAVHALHPAATVLGADTTVVLVGRGDRPGDDRENHREDHREATGDRGGSAEEIHGRVEGGETQEILSKPTDIAEAERMLRALSGRRHRVHTGVAVVTSQGSVTHVETTSVWFGEIDERDLAEYLSTGDPLDKAGGYGIQGYAARWITRVEGDFFNVVGLPVAATISLLRKAGELQGAGPASAGGGCR